MACRAQCYGRAVVVRGRPGPCGRAARIRLGRPAHRDQTAQSMFAAATAPVLPPSPTAPAGDVFPMIVAPPAGNRAPGKAIAIAQVPAELFARAGRGAPPAGSSITEEDGAVSATTMTAIGFFRPGGPEVL